MKGVITFKFLLAQVQLRISSVYLYYEDNLRTSCEFFFLHEYGSSPLFKLKRLTFCDNVLFRRRSEYFTLNFAGSKPNLEIAFPTIQKNTKHAQPRGKSPWRQKQRTSFYCFCFSFCALQNFEIHTTHTHTLLWYNRFYTSKRVPQSRPWSQRSEISRFDQPKPHSQTVRFCIISTIVDLPLLYTKSFEPNIVVYDSVYQPVVRGPVPVRGLVHTGLHIRHI